MNQELAVLTRKRVALLQARDESAQLDARVRQAVAEAERKQRLLTQVCEWDIDSRY